MPWHPPIPSEAVYSDEVAQLGSGLRLLWYLYNGVQRDGTVKFSPSRASDALDTPYETVRNWWQLLKPMGIVTIKEDHGKQGYLLKFHDDWLDWHVMESNYRRPASTVGQRSNETAEPVERSVNGSSIDFERSNETAENNVYGTHDSQESSPPETRTNGHKPTPNREMVMMLMAKGVKSSKVANEIAMMGLDYGTVEQSIDNQIASGAGIGAIVKWLQDNPPDPGIPYPKARSPAPRKSGERVAQTVGIARPPPAPPDAVPAREAAKRMLALRDQQRGVRPDDPS